MYVLSYGLAFFRISIYQDRITIQLSLYILLPMLPLRFRQMWAFDYYLEIPAQPTHIDYVCRTYTPSFHTGLNSYLEVWSDLILKSGFRPLLWFGESQVLLKDWSRTNLACWVFGFVRFIKKHLQTILSRDVISVGYNRSRSFPWSCLHLFSLLSQTRAQLESCNFLWRCRFSRRFWR